MEVGTINYIIFQWLKFIQYFLLQDSESVGEDSEAGSVVEKRVGK